MTNRRTIEIFSAGCPVCEAAIERIRAAACPSCEVVVQGMTEASVAERAKALGVRALPAVAVDGELAMCCGSGGPDIDVLRSLGLGQPIA